MAALLYSHSFFVVGREGSL